MKHASFLVIAIFTAILLTGCGKTNPMLQQYPQYVGEWQSTHDQLKIEKNGQVTYKYNNHENQSNADSQVSLTEHADIKAAITQYDAQHFEIGEGDLGKEFTVNRAPYEENGHWKMQVNGQVYTKQ